MQALSYRSPLAVDKSRATLENREQWDRGGVGDHRPAPAPAPAPAPPRDASGAEVCTLRVSEPYVRSKHDPEYVRLETARNRTGSVTTHGRAPDADAGLWHYCTHRAQIGGLRRARGRGACVIYKSCPFRNLWGHVASLGRCAVGRSNAGRSLIDGDLAHTPRLCSCVLPFVVVLCVRE